MVSKCHRCGVTKTFEHLGRKICSRCFVSLLEKRVKKSLGRVFSKDETVLVVGDLAEYFFDLVMKDFPVKKTKRKNCPSDIKKYDWVVIESTMDDIDSEFLNSFFSKNFKVAKAKKIVRILSAITDEEAVLFAKLKGINFSVDDKNKAIKDFLKKISLQHPEILFNLLKNVKKVEGTL